MISAKRLSKRLWRIFTDVFATIGVLVMIAEAASDVFNYQGLFGFYRTHIWSIVAIILIGCVWKNWDRLKYTVKIANSSDITITLRVRDALKNKGAIIIPTNSTFDTVMEDEFISEGSLQGQYQMKYFRGRIPELDTKILEGLTEKKYVVLNDGRKHNSNRYPIGTVSRVNEKNKRAYFLADSDIDPQGHPIDVDATDVSKALTSLWRDLGKNGNSEPYSIPLIGTGKARAKDVSRNEVAKQIILSFLASSKEHKITESLTICIHPGDFEKIDWDGLCEFLKYQSQYANIKPANVGAIGTAETTTEEIAYEAEYETEECDEDTTQSTNHFERSEISNHEQKMVTLLTGNKLSRTEIAEAMGLSMTSTNRLLKRLQDADVILSEGSSKQKRFFVSDKTDG